MLELVLPECLGKEEVACAGEVARELGLKTEKVNHTLYCKCTLSKLCGVCVCVCVSMQNPQCGLRVFKPGVQPEDFEQYLH